MTKGLTIPTLAKLLTPPTTTFCMPYDMLYQTTISIAWRFTDFFFLATFITERVQVDLYGGDVQTPSGNSVVFASDRLGQQSPTKVHTILLSKYWISFTGVLFYIHTLARAHTHTPATHTLSHLAVSLLSRPHFVLHKQTNARGLDHASAPNWWNTDGTRREENKEQHTHTTTTTPHHKTARTYRCV